MTHWVCVRIPIVVGIHELLILLLLVFELVSLVLAEMVLEDARITTATTLPIELRVSISSAVAASAADAMIPVIRRYIVGLKDLVFHR